MFRQLSRRIAFTSASSFSELYFCDFQFCSTRTSARISARKSPLLSFHLQSYHHSHSPTSRCTTVKAYSASCHPDLDLHIIERCHCTGLTRLITAQSRNIRTPPREHLKSQKATGTYFKNYPVAFSYLFSPAKRLLQEPIQAPVLYAVLDTDQLTYNPPRTYP